jgi:hypothetical protein
MPTINYIEILKRAWNITWNNRRLWWFGLLIAFASPGGLNFNGGGGNEKFDDASIQKASDFMVQNMHWIIAGAIALIVLIIILVIVGIIARAGLLKSIDAVLKNKPVGFKAGMKEGKKYLGRLFMLGLAISFLVLASVIVLATPVAFVLINKAFITGIFLGILAFIILIPVIILCSFLKTYGNIYVVLGELSAWNALEKAYELFRKNMLASIIMWLLFIPVGFLLLMAIIMILVPLGLLFLAAGFGLYFAAGTPGAIITACVGVICFLAIVLSFRSVYETFLQSAWYLFFLEIAKPKVEEKVEEEVLEKKEETLPVPDPVKTAEVEK